MSQETPRPSPHPRPLGPSTSATVSPHCSARLEEDRRCIFSSVTATASERTYRAPLRTGHQRAHIRSRRPRDGTDPAGADGQLGPAQQIDAFPPDCAPVLSGSTFAVRTRRPGPAQDQQHLKRQVTEQQRSRFAARRMPSSKQSNTPRASPCPAHFTVPTINRARQQLLAVVGRAGGERCTTAAGVAPSHLSKALVRSTSQSIRIGSPPTGSSPSTASCAVEI